jgi:hypothetical protein
MLCVHKNILGTVLRAAHLDLEGITMDREVMRIRDMLRYIDFNTLNFQFIRAFPFHYCNTFYLALNSLVFVTMASGTLLKWN